MDPIKKMVEGLSPLIAFIVNGAFATIFLVLYLAAPAMSCGISGIKLFNAHTPVSLVLLNLAFIFAPIAIMLVLTLKKKICPCFIYGLAYTYFIFMMCGAWGWGSIVNLLIILLPWCAFAFFRKDLPASVV